MSDSYCILDSYLPSVYFFTYLTEIGIKVHCSTGQVCEGFPDPITGDPVNFNFLPMFATSAMGVFPHTVQMYGLGKRSERGERREEERIEIEERRGEEKREEKR